MKLLDYSGLQRFLNKIKTLLDSKANTQHTHSTSDVTDLLSDQHTWSSQQSYNADLNLNYSSTDVDDIIDTLAGSYTAEDFLAQNNVWTGNNTFTANVSLQGGIYAQNYYLGTTAFGDIVTHNASEFLTSHQSLSNYVTLDGAQTISGAKTFTGTLTGTLTGNCSGSSGSCTGNAATATQFSANKDVTLTGDVTGTASSKAGWSVATTLSDSGVTAGTYGPSADVTGNNNATISVPEITVDSKGRVTSVANRTLTCKNNTYNVYNKTLTIQKNGTNVATFTSNSNTDVTANITVPTKTSELTNDSGFLTSHQSLSNYVTLNGTQTITGTKTFQSGETSINIKATNHEKGVAPSGNQHNIIQFTDKNGIQTGFITRLKTSGYSCIQISSSDLYKNSAMAADGTNTSATFTVGTSTKGVPYWQAPMGAWESIYPHNERTTLTLGTATNKWNAAYVQEYHAYNANAFMAKTGDYTFLIRNDGGSTYFLMSAQGGNEGTWTNARPLTIANATGMCDINGSCGGTSHGLLSSLTQYGDSVTYTEGMLAIGTAAGNAYKGSSNNAALISFPENGTFFTDTATNVQNLRLAWSGDWKFWHDIFVSPNNNYIWHRDVVNGGAKPWRRVVEENATGLTNQTWSINIGGSATSATNDGSGNVISTTYGKLASANTWSAVNTFSAGQLKLKSAYQEIGVTPANNTVQYFEFNDKNNTQLGAICLRNYNNGASEIQMYITDKFKNGAKDPTGTSESAFLSFGFKAGGSKFLTFSGQVHNSLIPNASNTHDLGSDSYRWKSINGVNPGALFLPKLSSKVSLSERLTDLTGQTSLYYTPPYNGWISIVTDNTSSSNFIRCTYDNILAKADGNAKQSGMSILCPVLAGVQVTIYVKCVTLTSAFFYPSLGDVNSTT